MLTISASPVNKQASCRSELQYPHKPSEFEIQAFLFINLRRMGYDVRGEVKGHARASRFDLVIFGKERSASGKCRPMPVRIIEVKRGRQKVAAGTACGDQVLGYYEKYGIPVDLVGSFSEAHAYLAEIGRTICPPAKDFPCQIDFENLIGSA